MMKDYIQQQYSFEKGILSYNQLRTVVKEAWDSISIEQLNGLINTMHDCCQAIIDANGTWCCESTFGPPIAPLWLYGSITGVFNQQNIVIYPKKLLLPFFIIHISSLCLKPLQRCSMKGVILCINSILIHSFNCCSFSIVISPISQFSSISFSYAQ